MIQVNPERNHEEQKACEDSIAADFSVFDLESAPLDDVTLAALCPPCDIPPRPGEFDPAAVKYGNTKDEVKRKAKLEEEMAKHAAAVKDYDATVAQSQVDHFAKFKDKAALDATTGRVVAIGISGPSAPGIIDCDGDREFGGEEHGLSLFWSWVAENIQQSRPMIGHNIFSFDLPFLCRRSFILGVPIPVGVRQGRNWSPLFLDTMIAWTFGKYSEYVGLDRLALAFGFPGKVEEVEVDGVKVAVSGATFYQLWRTNRKVAETYLMADLRIPGELARRMGIV